MSTTDDLEAQLAELRARMAKPGPSADQLAEWDEEDRAMIPRVRAIVPGVPTHHVFAVLKALRTIRWAADGHTCDRTTEAECPACHEAERALARGETHL